MRSGVYLVQGSKVADLRLNVASKLGFPSVSIGEEALFIKEELLVIDCCVFVVGSFHDSINGAGILAKSAVDALGHVDIVASGSS
jgi:hypothetical protein